MDVFGSNQYGAVVVDMPTSSGKTALAEFRILQALNQYQDSKGWIAYVVPTRTLVNQICARLRRNLGHPKLNIKIAKMSGAVEIDGFEPVHQLPLGKPKSVTQQHNRRTFNHSKDATKKYSSKPKREGSKR